jgi:hypothetical protein
MNLDISGQSVQSVSIDYAFTLRTDGDAEIRIETAFSVRDAAGGFVVGDPGQLGSNAGRVVAVLHETVADAMADDDGNLVLDFVNGLRITVECDESYEAWTFAGPDGRKLVAQAGGGVSEWSPNT